MTDRKAFDLKAEELENDSPDGSSHVSHRTKGALRKSVSDTRAMVTKHTSDKKKMSGLGTPLNSTAPRRHRRVKSFEAIREGWYPKPHSKEGKVLPRALFVGPQWVREAVSKEKIRLDTEDGYSLDLAYITKNIIAMGFPSSGINGLYRNHFKDVKSYLESRHPSKYRLWNLCIERRYVYSFRSCSNTEKTNTETHARTHIQIRSVHIRQSSGGVSVYRSQSTSFRVLLSILCVCR